MESIVRSRRSADKPHPSPLLDAILSHQTQVDTAATELAAAGAGETQLTPERGAEQKDAEVTETSPKFKTPKKKVDDFVFKTPIKTVDGSLTTPIKALGNLLTPVKGITAIEAKDPEPLPSLTTPQKSLLLSPKTPVSRHIPASPVLFSPSAARVAVPRTPSSARTRTRHQSSLHTPVNTPTSAVEEELSYNSPTTPDSKRSPAPSYYTPSPSPRSDYSVPSPSYTPGLKFLQEEGDRLSQSDDSCSSTPSPAKSRITGAQKRKTFRNLFKKATTEAAGKELGSLLEQKILKYPFGSGEEKAPGVGDKSPGLEPFMSPAGGGSYDYTSSPQIMMRPSPTGPGQGAAEGEAGPDASSMSRHSSFVSPNRTCYLSPTGVALTSSVLGFHQSPVQTTDSEADNQDQADLQLVLESSDEDTDARPGPGADTEARTPAAEAVMSQTAAAETVALEAATDSAVADTEESVEAIKVSVIVWPNIVTDSLQFPLFQEQLSSTLATASFHNLSDESNTLSNHLSLAAAAPAAATQAVFNSSIEKIDAPNLSDESDEDISEVDSSTERKAHKYGSFVESYLHVETSSSKQIEKEKENKNIVTFTPRKPRRVALISTKRKSPIKNGSTKFEIQHDANNLDKNLHADASQILDQNLGAEASIDLGLEADVEEKTPEKKTPEVRKSPRKHKRKHSSSPVTLKASSKNIEVQSSSKRQKLPEKTDCLENNELTLCFSPEKKRPQFSKSLKESKAIVPDICQALGLTRSDTSEAVILLNVNPVVDSNSEDSKQERKTSGPPSNARVKDSSVERDKNSRKKEAKEDSVKMEPSASQGKLANEKSTVGAKTSGDITPRLDIDKIALESAKILSSLSKSTKSGSTDKKNKPKPENSESHSKQSSTISLSKESTSVEQKSVFTRSEFFVFQNKLPFGEFD